MSTGPDEQPIPKYRDYPALFWDLKPEEPIDVENPFVLARLLTQGNPEIIGRLVPTELIRRELPTLPIPEHTRLFWGMVLNAIERRRSSRPG